MKKRSIINVYWLESTELWTAKAETWDSGFFKVPGTSKKIKDFSDKVIAEIELMKFFKPYA